ncbi:hypothetical protein [Methylobacterium radiotolerans]|uniref:hypothetical protein n=1 Tax=Methylobacterium radiotolerans TaxID=31998 RepID=UPI001402AD8D|nr:MULTISPECIES: hypothetical protein [Methylobacterium]MDE3749709.1 hypothetical protein [Methylobacterium radiotolerans]
METTSGGPNTVRWTRLPPPISAARAGTPGCDPRARSPERLHGHRDDAGRIARHDIDDRLIAPEQIRRRLSRSVRIHRGTMIPPIYLEPDNPKTIAEAATRSGAQKWTRPPPLQTVNVSRHPVVFIAHPRGTKYMNHTKVAMTRSVPKTSAAPRIDDILVPAPVGARSASAQGRERIPPCQD